MYQDVTSIKPLYLSEEETMAILDLCLTSSIELDDAKVRALRKVTDLARTYLRPAEEAQAATAPHPVMEARRNGRGEDGQDEGSAGASDGARVPSVTPFTMMFRSVGRAQSSLRRMGTALSERRQGACS
jgi:hypothetical protein